MLELRGLIRKVRHVVDLRCGTIFLLAFSTCLMLFGEGKLMAEEVLPAAIRNVGIDQNLGRQIPLDLPFVDEQGRSVRLGDYFGGHKPVILTLVYFKCPMLCTVELNDTLRSLRAMPDLKIGTDFDVLSVSFDPHEGPELALKKKEHYVAEYRHPGAEKGWHFLTGSESSIASLTDAVGFHYQYDAQQKQYIHPSGIIVLKPNGEISRYFMGINYEPKDLRLALTEASQGKVGSLADQVLLLCSHYDPLTGKYSLAILNIIRAFGVVVLIALGGFLFLMFRREKGRHSGPPQV